MRGLRSASYFIVACVALYLTIPSVTDFLSEKAGEPQDTCSDRGSTEHNPYNKPRPTEEVRVIELTNSGLYVDRCQLRDAYFDLIWDDPSRNQEISFKKGAVSRPKLVVMYVHGWKHNGDPKDEDFLHFSHMVGRLRSIQGSQKNVVGIYIGWNGKSLFPPFDELTFWSKEKIADRIAQSGTVTDIVSSIAAITKKYPDRFDQFIAIGHSFGARILFSASAQHLISATEMAYPDKGGGEYGIVQGAADAVILLNPAFEAARYTSMDNFRGVDASFQLAQNPLVVTIAADNDWATQLAFPIGQWFGGERQVKEKRTVGNFEAYVTHHLAPAGEDGCLAPGLLNSGDAFKADDLCLKRDMDPVRNKMHNPFIVAEASSSVIDGHGGIWEDAFSDWLFHFVDALGHSVTVAKKVEAIDKARSATR